MASTVIGFTVGVFVSFILINEIFAQSQTCSLRKENEVCTQRSDCCSRCCLSGKCAKPGNCFTDCDPSKVSSGRVAADICNITLLYAELMDTSENMTDGFLYQVDNLIEKILPIAEQGMTNPMTLMINMPVLLNAVQGFTNYINSSQTNVQEEINVAMRMFQYVMQLISDVYKSIIETNN